MKNSKGSVEIAQGYGRIGITGRKHPGVCRDPRAAGSSGDFKGTEYRKNWNYYDCTACRFFRLDHEILLSDSAELLFGYHFIYAYHESASVSPVAVVSPQFPDDGGTDAGNESSEGEILGRIPAAKRAALSGMKACALST